MQLFQNSTLSEALADGCDTVQIKWDGLWSQFSIHKGEVRVLNSLSRHDPVEIVRTDPSEDAVLIGTWSKGQTPFRVFDCWVATQGEDQINLTPEPYRLRYTLARIHVKIHPRVFSLVENVPIARAVDLWTSLPWLPGAKGLVFRNSKDDAKAVLRCARWYAEAPRELV